MYRNCPFGVYTLSESCGVGPIHIVADAVHRQEKRVYIARNIAENFLVIKGIARDIVFSFTVVNYHAYRCNIAVLGFDSGKFYTVLRPFGMAVKQDIIIISADSTHLVPHGFRR